MQIIYKKTFEKQLLHILNYIAQDKVNASIQFANELEKLIFLIPDNPLKYKSSIYFQNGKHMYSMRVASSKAVHTKS